MSAETPDLGTAWKDACAEFESATGFSLSSTSQGKRADDIVGKFEAAKTKDAEARIKIDKAKAIVGKTVVAVERLGSIAAQGASMVFGSPANITMNCISFFIDIGMAYKDIARNIDDLFGRIVTILERFQIYRDYEQIMKAPMINIAHRLLIAIVDICRLCITRMNRNRIKKFLEIALFSSDGGIRDQFEVLERLQEEEKQMKGTLTLVAVELNQRAITSGFENMEAKNKELLSNVAQMNETKAEQKILQDIKESLHVEDSLSQTEYQSHLDKLLPKSCSWLKSDAQFKSWSDTASGQSPLLLLHGDEGHSKSFTFTGVVRELLGRYSQYRQATTRLSVAYCYLTRSGRKDNSSSKSNPTTRDAQSLKSGATIRDALREWSWQIAKQDQLYRKAVHALLKQGPDLGSIESLWKHLFFDHMEEGVSFFLLLDGTHELDERSTNDLVTFVRTIPSTTSASNRFRVAITVRPNLLQKLTTKISVEPLTVDLRDKTHSDMEKFIQEKANDLAIFEKTSSEVQELKKQVCSKLLDAVNGNFILAELKLKEISTKYDPEEVKQIVEKVKGGAGLEGSIVDHIRNCNRTLTTREIEDLNVLLLWVMYGEWSFSVSELEAVLFIQQERASLQPLANEIRGKFSSFFDLDSDTDDANASVSLKYDSIADYFKNISEEQTVSGTSAHSALTKGEIRMVQHFIEKLCDHDIYVKLGLGDFFDHKLSQSDTSVAVDCENAHAKMALICLRFLNTPSTDESEHLKWYALNHLTTHLKKIDLDKIDPRLKAELGSPLINMFRDPVVIRRANEASWQIWSYLDDEIRDVLRLLRSSALTSKITTSKADNRDWVDEILKDSNPEIALLKDSAKEFAQSWLSSDDESKVMDSFKWLFGYVNKVQNSRDSEKERFKESISSNNIDQDEIQDVLQEMRKLQPSDTNGSNLVAARNIAITYLECEHVYEAIQQFNDILAVEAENLQACAGLARSYGRETSRDPKPDWEKALSYQDVVIEHVKSGTQLYPSVTSIEHLKTLLMEKATWLRKLQQYDASREIYLDMLQKDPNDDFVRLQYIFTLCESQAYGAVVESLDDMDSVDDETQENRLMRFIHSNASDSDYHSTISHAFKQANSTAKILRYYKQALQEASKDGKKASWDMKYAACALTYHLGAILWKHGESTEQKEEAINLWEQLTDLVKKDGITFYEQILTARRLARIYVGKAVAAGRDSKLASEMLEKVEGFARPAKGESVDDDDSWGIGLSAAQGRSLLGRYHSRVGDFEKAKALLQPDVNLGIKLLSDDDDENDYQGYRKLGDAFMDFGDEKNAIAAWTLIQPTKGLKHYRTYSMSASLCRSPSPTNDPNAKSELGAKESSPEPSPEPFSVRKRHLVGPLHYGCDGRCGVSWTYADDIWVCRECIDIQFDAPCLEKLRRGELKRDICDKTHNFLYIPKWDLESAERAEAGKVLVGDQEMTVKDWLEGIKREWSLESSETKENTPVVVVTA